MHLLPLARHRGNRETRLAPVVVTLILLALVIVTFLLLPPAAAGAWEFATPVAHSTPVIVEAMHTSLA